MDRSAAIDGVLGFVPVKSISIPKTLMLPFIEVPSKVPVKMTSVGEPCIGKLIVKLNLSPLR